MNPITLSSNQPANRFYLGGSQIASFRGEPASGNHIPEDWVASTTTVFGHRNLGLTTLPSGVRLIDAINQDPIAWLGRGHFERYGVDTKLLVKLLDAGQRLPVHAHPTSFFASSHLGRSHGKAEAWYILADGEVHVGLKERILLPQLLELVQRQDVETLLGLLHTQRVHRGDTVYIPAGTLHAIGAGTFLLEVQEPEDLSILLEWRDFELDGARDGHLGLGFETALSAVDLNRRSDSDISALISRNPSGPSLLPEISREFFELSHYVVEEVVSLEAGFAVIVVIAGQVQLQWNASSALYLEHGSTTVVPFGVGPLHLTGHGEVVICRPPRS